jgi:predicted nucleic acid-binding protein
MATTSVKNCFIDTNILIYAKLAHSPFHTKALAAMKPLIDDGVTLWISRQVLREYLAVMTRPSTLTETIPVTSLLEDVRYFSSRFSVAEENATTTEKLSELLLKIPCGGKQIHDANIVATMLTYGVTHLLTHNGADFARFSAFVEVIGL